MPWRKLVYQTNEDKLFIFFWWIWQAGIHYGISKRLQLFVLMISNGDLRCLHCYRNKHLVRGEILWRQPFDPLLKFRHDVGKLLQPSLLPLLDRRGENVLEYNLNRTASRRNSRNNRTSYFPRDIAGPLRFRWLFHCYAI